MPFPFPGLKTVTYGPVFVNVGTITKARLTIPSSRLTGSLSNLYMKTSASNAWEECSNGVDYTFTATGNKLYVRIVASGAVISGRMSNNNFCPAIFAKIVEVA